MKILQVINSLNIGGAEKLLVDSIPLYKAKGINMELLLLNGTKTPFFYELEKKGVNIHFLSADDIKTVYNPLHIFQIIPYLKQYDIIHVHLFPALYWVALAKWLSLSKKTLIYTEHSTKNRRIKNKGIWWILDKFIYKRYSKIVSISLEVDTAIKLHLFEKDAKFCIINNGINLSNFNKTLDKKAKEVEKTKITIIQVAGFREEKDQATVIRALQYLPENVTLLLVGEGKNRIDCENLVKELNLLDKVLFLGIRTDVPELLESSYIVVVSSHWEGFGLTAVEGMAAGKPVVASNVPGLNNIVNEAGLLFTQGDEKDLAKKIQSLIDNPDFYNKIAQNCKERAKLYDINTMVDKYFELYKMLI